MTKFNNSDFNKKISILNWICIIGETVLLILFLILLFISLMLLVAVIFQSLSICETYICWLEGKLIYLSNCEKINLITAFGVFASVTFIPLLSFLLSLIVSNKSRNEKIDEEFGKFKKLSFYIISLPFGIWNSQVINYQGSFENFSWKRISLLDYDYCLCLAFNNDCFPYYELILNGISYYKEKMIKRIELRNRDNALKYPYFISDTSGINVRSRNNEAECPYIKNNKKSQDGTTQLSVLLKTGGYEAGNKAGDEVKDRTEELNESECKNNREFIKYFIYDMTKKKEISFNIRLKTRENKSFKELCNALNGKFYYWFFPFIRTFFKWCIEKIQKVRQYEIRLRLESAPSIINERKTKFEFNIVDIDISTKKGRPYENKKNN